jgi:hypothetical protein
MNAIKARYRVPSYTPECQTVYLSDFDISEIREYLKNHANKRGESPEDFSGEPEGGSDCDLVIPSEDLGRIETLAMCGQIEYAREEVLRIVSDHIGRAL